MSEIRLDTDAVVDGAWEVANLLTGNNIAYFEYAAFGTGWGMVVADHREMPGVGFTTPPGVGGRPYLAWTKYGPGNQLHGSYLGVGLLHTPGYLAEKFDTTLVDGLGIGLMIGMVEYSWREQERPEGWIDKGKELIERSGMKEARPHLDLDLPSFWQSQ